MTKEKKVYDLNDLLEKASNYISTEEEIDKIKEAYEYAKEKHANQVRLSGEPYIVHPLEVAIILTSMYADVPTIVAALLHDVIEDCDVTSSELEERFGKEVSSLVMGVTKLGRINFSTENDYLIEYYKKIIVGMSEDVRVIIIKLADRLHNMRTLFVFPEDKQKEKARETLEILTPIAHHLGIYKIKSELEDLSLRYLKPDVFYDIAERLNKTRVERDETVNDMLEEVSNLLTDHNIIHEIKGRAKSIYSIYNKLNKGRKFSDIYDLLALRILVKSEQECYLAIGIIHSKFKPISKRFKDFIAMPKLNGYRSLHTTVFGINGYLFEIQIRTHEMDEINENGMASHWAYKEKIDAKEVFKSTTDQKLQFFKSIIELNEDKMSSEEFVNSVKNEVLNNNIYVFTPKGDIIELPIGATPVDFAYKVHSKVGETMIGAIVNNNIVPLNYELKDQDIVKINTNKNSKGPSKEWLKFVKSTQTKNKIKAFFSKTEREVYVERGKEALEKDLRKKKIGFNEFFTDENIKILLTELKLEELDDLYLSVGNGKYAPLYIINLIIKKPDIEVPRPKEKRIISKINDTDIFVSGIDKVKVNIANCCNPIPGDEIIGYITKGNGINIHRSNCHNLILLEDRTINVEWNDITNNKYLTTLMIYTNTLENNVLDIIQKVGMNEGITDRITSLKDKSTTYELDIYIKDINHLNKIITELNKIKYIKHVERLIR